MQRDKIIVIIGLCVLTIAIILSITFLRNIGGNVFPPGQEYYYHLNAFHNPLTFFDQLSSFFITQDNHLFFAPIISLIFGLLSVILFYLLIDKKIGSPYNLLCVAVLLLTPTFLAFHTTLGPYPILMSIALLFALYPVRWISLLLFMFDPLIGSLSFLYLFGKEKGKQLVGSILLLTFLIVVWSFTNFAFIETRLITFSVNNIFGFFGGRFGYTLFSLVLGIGGLYISRNKFSVYNRGLLLMVFLLSLFYIPLRIVVVPILVYFSLIALKKLFEDNWVMSLLKPLTLILFVCILLFSTVTFISEDINRDPSNIEIESLLFLREATVGLNESKAGIIQYGERDYFVKYFTPLRVVDSYNQLVSMRDYNALSLFLKKEQVALLYLDKSDLQEDEGLLFILNHNDRFILLFENEKYLIYYFREWSIS